MSSLTSTTPNYTGLHYKTFFLETLEFPSHKAEYSLCAKDHLDRFDRLDKQRLVTDRRSDRKRIDKVSP